MPEYSVDKALIHERCKAGEIRWSQHALSRLFQRNISTNDVINVLLTGEFIENYPSDYPYPSCLTFGLSINSQPLHVVFGLGESELWIITVYRPNPTEWESDFKTRRKK